MDERFPAIRVTMLPKDTNAFGTIFGGVILSYIDLAGAIEARRHYSHRFVTKAMREVAFVAPVYLGDLVTFFTRVARIGNTYTASLYLCLAALLEREGRALASRRLGLFSYGSGCCAEFFTGTVPRSIEGAADAGVDGLLARRTLLEVEQYERFARAAETGGEPPPGFAGEFVFLGVRQGRREYARTSAALAA